jgi:hypothetical protein
VPLLHEAIAPRRAASTRVVVDYPIKDIIPTARTSVIVVTTVITIARTISRAIRETVAIVTAIIVKLITT